MTTTRTTTLGVFRFLCWLLRPRAIRARLRLSQDECISWMQNFGWLQRRARIEKYSWDYPHCKKRNPHCRDMSCDCD